MDPLSIVGAGYVGLVSAACFAVRGHNVVVAERDRERVKLLTKGKTPFYEPGLDGLLKRSASRISFTTDLSAAIQESDLTFVCVGTPSRKDGSINLSQIKSSLREIGSALLPGKGRLIVVRSTVVPGTTWKVVRPILEKASGSKVGQGFLLAMQPEFLREGNAIEDMLHPDRIVIGECSRQAGDHLQRFYEAFHGERRPPILRMNPTSAELVKYASNAFLAMKVSFMNEIANICERLDDVDVVSVAEAVGLDPRITEVSERWSRVWGVMLPKGCESDLCEGKRTWLQIALASRHIRNQ
jgi:UDPglucose 6-dehydrogenase